jgi:hypothetical protein
MIVVCTDHGQKWTGCTRTPLIFHFPGGKHSGHIKENTQNLDISATILDYLGIEQPEWLGGLSILSSGGESLRPIFSIERISGLRHARKGGRELDKRSAGPPFFAMKIIIVVFCNKNYYLYLERNQLVVSSIEGHTSPCDSKDIPDSKRIGRLIIAYLKENGYDVSSIRTPLLIRERPNR